MCVTLIVAAQNPQVGYVDTWEPSAEMHLYPGPYTPSEGSYNSPAYYSGVQAGEFFNDSIDAATDFLHGFNEMTGASEWARERWTSARVRINEWNASRQSGE